MFNYIIRRLLGMIPILLLISLVTFAIIQLPPGDFATSYASNLSAMGDTNSQEALKSLRETYGLDQPVIVQYFKWISNVVMRGDFGISFEFREPVSVENSRQTDLIFHCSGSFAQLARPFYFRFRVQAVLSNQVHVSADD